MFCRCYAAVFRRFADFSSTHFCRCYAAENTSLPRLAITVHRACTRAIVGRKPHFFGRGALWLPNNAPRRSASLTWAHAPTNPTTAAHVLRNAFVCARSPLLPLLRCRLAEKKQNWNFCSFCTRTLLPVTRDESGVRGQNFARAGAKVSSTTYRDTEPPAYNLHASPQPRARRTHPTRNIRNGPTRRLESRNKAFPLDNMGSPPT